MAESAKVVWSAPRIEYGCTVCKFITGSAKSAVEHVQSTRHSVEKMVCETLTLSKAGA